MVQIKYFGDSRDYFKYDLIQTVLRQSSLRHYVFFPMLTEHRMDNEGKIIPKNRSNKSTELLDFIAKCRNKSLKHWERWLSCYAQSYATVEPVDHTFFSDDSRSTYWKAFQHKLSKRNALVFVDPDTGLKTGSPSYLRKMGREKYILDIELQSLLDHISPTSVLMLYQHLPKNKHIHARSVERKLAQVRSANAMAYACACACAYREDDLAFLFISKQQSRRQEMYGILGAYHTHSTHRYKSLHA